MLPRVLVASIATDILSSQSCGEDLVYVFMKQADLGSAKERFRTYTRLCSYLPTSPLHRHEDFTRNEQWEIGSRMLLIENFLKLLFIP